MISPTSPRWGVIVRQPLLKDRNVVLPLSCTNLDAVGLDSNETRISSAVVLQCSGNSRNSRPLVSHVVGCLFLFLFCFDRLGEVSSSLGVQFIKYWGMRFYVG